jgi:exodeoxyribonuclease-5
MRSVLERSQGSRVRFAFTAPTNKAAKELAKVTGTAGTIFSLLCLRIDKSGELKELVAGEKPDLSETDVIFIDEAGMVNQNLMNHLKAHVNGGHLKVVFMGDEAQLPPVKEEISPVWKEKVPGATLSTVMRHDNQILDLVTHIRHQIYSPMTNIQLKSNNDGTEGVWKLTKQALKMRLYDLATQGAFADGEKTKVIAWRNVRVGEYNDLIRAGIFGKDAISGYFLPGERVIAAGPCKIGEDVVLATDMEAVVTSVREAQHPGESKYKMQELKCLTEDGRNIRLWVLHPESLNTFNNDCESLAHAARTDGRLWRKFWALKDIFHEVKYAYAITTHRSQGSTYTEVLVDAQDILLNRNRKESLQCLYVACSRPTTRLYLA